MRYLNLVTGFANIAFVLIILIFMIQTKLRKNRLTPFVWMCLSNLLFCSIITGVGQIYYADIFKSENCNFGLNLIYGVENIIIFNLSIIVGFRTYILCNEISEFALKGNLPSERAKKYKHWIVRIMWFCSGSYLLVYLIIGFTNVLNSSKPIDLLNSFNYVTNWI